MNHEAVLAIVIAFDSLRGRRFPLPSPTYLAIWSYVVVAVAVVAASTEAEVDLVFGLRHCLGAPRFLARHLSK